jgi:transposase
MLFCGIDLHTNNCLVVVSDDNDKVLYSKRLPNHLATICTALSPYQQELFGVVVESTYNWYWLVDGLVTAGYSLHLANTTAIKQYDGLKHRGDESDARHLAHVLRLGLLPEGHIMPKAERAFRDLARRRMQLVGQRTSQIVSIETSMAQHMGATISGNSVKELTVDDIDAMPIGPTEALGMKANLAIMQALQVQIDGIEATLSKHCRRDKDYRLLCSVAGIGPILATVILLETGDIGRFADVGNYASYCRCVGSAHMSNGRKRAKAIPRTETALAWAYVEAANFAIR